MARRGIDPQGFNLWITTVLRRNLKDRDQRLLGLANLFQARERLER